LWRVDASSTAMCIFHVQAATGNCTPQGTFLPSIFILTHLLLQILFYLIFLFKDAASKATESVDERMMNEYETLLELYSGGVRFESPPKHWVFRVRIANRRYTVGQNMAWTSEGPRRRQRSSPYIVKKNEYDMLVFLCVTARILKRCH
jgi:hypothetical protein